MGYARALKQRFADLRLRNKLIISYSTMFILAVSLMNLTIYLLVRQTIESAIDNELKNSTETILSMVETSANTSIKAYLHGVAEKNKDIARHYFSLHRTGLMSESEAKAAAAEVMLAQAVGKTGYIYCVDTHGKIVVHPKAALLGQDLSRHEFIRDQTRRKQGYLEYDWKNPGESAPRPKALYMTFFQPWNWIISASSYRSEFTQLVNVDDFRESILALKFGETGYPYVVDSKGNMIIHHRLKGNYYDVQDIHGRQFVREICEKKSGKTVYAWESKDGTEILDKVVLFNYIPEFDWIVVSSGYLDEFYAPLRTVRLIFAVSLFLILALVLTVSFGISESITNPLQELMNRFDRGAKGDISVRMETGTRDEMGKLAGYFNTFMERLEISSNSLKAEITESRRAHREMARMRRYLKSIVDSMPSVLVGVDPEGRVTQWNREAEAVSQIAREQAVGKALAVLEPELARAVDLPAPEPVTGTARVRERVVHPFKGKRFYSDILVYPLTGEGWEGAVIRVDDISERVRMENLIVQTEKMKSVGGLAAGMAHEINNPLGCIVQSTQNILRRFSPNLAGNREAAAGCGTDLEKIREYLEEREIIGFLEDIRVSVDRTSRIVVNMLNFSRRSSPQKRAVSLADLLEKTISLAGHDYDLKKRYGFREIRIIRDFSQDLAMVPCNASEIEQVVLNLLRNAAQALAGQAKKDFTPEIRLTLRNRGKRVLLRMADNGPGMDAETRKRVFEPFFTTKAVGDGTGLGLSVSYYIITNNHMGTIGVESAPGQGAAFSILLPVQREEISNQEGKGGRQ